MHFRLNHDMSLLYPKLCGLFTIGAAPLLDFPKIHYTFGESDTCPLTFLKSPSNIDYIK